MISMMKRFKFDDHRRPDVGNRHRVDEDDGIEVFAEDIAIDTNEVPERKRHRYDAEDLLEKAEREEAGLGSHSERTDDVPKQEETKEDLPDAA